MNTSISGKVALITGGLGEIAFIYAKQLMFNGIRGIVLVDVEDKNSKKRVKKLEKSGKGDVLFFKRDVNIYSQLTDAFETTVKEFQQLDIFINSAAILDESRWERMITTNLIAGFTANQLAMRKYLSRYKSEGEGTIVNTICTTAVRPLASLAVYSSIKWGLMGMHRALSHGHWNNAFNCRFLALCPGLTRTPLLRDMASKGIDLDLYDEECSEMPVQGPDKCGECLVTALRNGKNGSVWICEAGQIYEWVPPDRFEVRKLLKEEENKAKKGYCK